MLVIGAYAVSRIKGSLSQKRRRIETGLMTGQVPVTGKIIDYRIRLNHRAGQIFTYIPIENAGGFIGSGTSLFPPLPTSQNFLTAILTLLNLFPDSCQDLIIIETVPAVQEKNVIPSAIFYSLIHSIIDT